MRKFPDVGDGDIRWRRNTDDVPGTGPGVGALLDLERSCEQSVGTAHAAASSLQQTLGGLED